MRLTPDAAGARIGPFWITPGWTRLNAATVWAASFLTIGLAAFISFVQPYLLTEVLHLPDAIQGRLTGSLGALQEIIVICSAGFFGVWSDRSGRRRVYYLGFLAMAAGFAIYPLADTVAELVLFRCVFALGIAMAPLMLSACVVDAIQEVSRGRWIASNTLLQGLGVVIMSFLLAKMPAWFESRGVAPVDAIRYAFWMAAALALLAAAVVFAGLPRLAPGHIRGRGRGAWRLVGQALGLARRNPRLGIAYGAAFIGRGDFTIVGVFFSLWLVQAGRDAGMSSAEALATAGKLFGILQLAAMLWAPAMGWLVDRLRRLDGLCLALALAGTGYLLMGQMTQPFDAGFIPFAVLLGIGEMSVIVAAGALLGQEAPLENRGPVIGFYNAVGGVGILFATFVGGQVFDAIGRTAPFSLMGLLNLVLLAAALLVRVRAARAVQAVTPCN